MPAEVDDVECLTTRSRARSHGRTTVQNLEWFEVVETRGHIDNGTVAHFQVTPKRVSASTNRESADGDLPFPALIIDLQGDGPTTEGGASRAACATAP